MIKMKIIKKFLEDRNKKYTINKLSKLTNIDYKLVHTNIKKLEQEKIIIIEKIGNSSQCSLTNNFNHLILRAEEERTQELLKNQDLRIISEEIMKINNPFFSLIVFGSQIRKPSKQSDIDLCLITNEDNISKEINKKLRLLPLKIELINFSQKEFQEMLYSRKLNVVKEIYTNNIILRGIQNYYELIRNA